MSYVIGVDSSTSGVKAVAFDNEGHQVALGRATLASEETRPGWHEQNCEDWLEGLYIALDQLRDQINLNDVKAMAVTSQRETFVLLDKDNCPVRPAITWMDTRCAEQVEQHGNEQVHALTGKPPATVNAIYSLIWLHENEPASISKTATVYDVTGYLMHRMTGLRATCFATADTMSVVDLSRQDYSDEVIALAGLKRDQFPQMIDTGETAGPITDAFAERTGLPKALPVVSTIGDGQAAGVGANVVDGDMAYVSLGTGVAIGAGATDYSHSPAYRTLVGYKPGTFYLESLVANGSYLISWFIRKFGVEGGKETGQSAEQVLEKMARGVPAGSDGLFCVPYFSGCMTPHWDGNSRGAFIGWRGSHGMPEMYRSILEGISFDIKLCLDGIIEARGAELDGLIAMGGGSNSELWCQTLADITGCSIQVCEQQEVTALGAAVHAAANVGLCGTNSISHTANKMGRMCDKYLPNPEQHAIYAKHFEIYKKLYGNLADTYGEIALLDRG